MERHGMREPSQDDGALRQLERDRISNDNKLKTRFEHIFRKYEHDFEGVGDEIEIASGDIVVNNGHLQHMKYEVDPGKGASSRFVRTFQETLEEEGESESGSSSEEEEDSEEYSQNDDTYSVAEDTPEPYGRESTVDTFATSSDLRRTLKPFSKMARPAPRLAQLLIGEGTPQQTPGPGYPSDVDSQYTRSTASATPTPSAMLGRVPNLHRSVLALNASRQNADSDTIQALGVSIANQLAQLMAGSTQKGKKKKKPHRERRATESRDPVWDYPELDRMTRHKRRRSQSPMEPPPLPSSPQQSVSPGASSLWAPSETGQGHKRRRLDLQSGQQPTSPVILRQTANLLPSSESRRSATEVKRCWNCSVTSTSTWHKGPHDQDLCSSCGRYYEFHRRMKPFDSPTPPAEEGESHRDLDTVDEPGFQHDVGDIAFEDPATREALLQPHVDMIDYEDAALGYRQGDGGAPVPRAAQESVRSKARTRPPNRSLSPSPQPLSYQERDTSADSAEQEQDDEADAAPIAAHRVQPAERPEVRLDHTASPSWYPANTSRPLLVSPSNRKAEAHYTIEEDALIIRLKERELLSWNEIIKHFNGRTSSALQTRYSTTLRNQPTLGRQHYEAQISATFEPAAAAAEQALWKDHAWSREQDEVLFDLREDKALTWSEIAHLLPGHTPEAVAQRYEMLVEAAKRHRVHNPDQNAPETDDSELPQAPLGQRKDPYSPEEDALIVRLKEIEGLAWTDIAKKLPGRQLHSVQKHYSLALEPKKRKTKRTSRHDPIWGTMEDRILAVDPTLAGRLAWTPAEDDLLKKLREQDSLGWDEIAARVWRRTPKELQHRYEYKFAVTPPETQSSKNIRDKVASQLYAAAQESKATHETTSSGPGGRMPFTDKEDRLIFRLREKQGLSWEDVTLQLPGRSVNSVSSRYEELRSEKDSRSEKPSDDRGNDRYSRDIVHLRDSMAPGPALAANQLSESHGHLRFSPQEDELIVALRQKGLEWPEIGAHLPDRTLATIKNRWSTNLKFTVRRSLPSAPVSHRKKKYMLREAIGNRLRRRTVDNPLRFDDPAQDELANDDDEGGTLTADVQSDDVDTSAPSDQLSERSISGRSERVPIESCAEQSDSGRSQNAVSSNPSVGGDLEMFESMLQAATRFAIQQKNPTLFARIREIYDQDPNDPRLHRLLELVSANTASSSQVISELEHVVNTSPESSKSATRSLQAALTATAGKPTRGRQSYKEPQARNEEKDLANEETGHALPIDVGEQDDIDNALALMEAFEPAAKPQSTRKARFEKGVTPGEVQSSNQAASPSIQNKALSRNRRSSIAAAPRITPEQTPPPLDTHESPSSVSRQSSESSLASPARPELSFSELVRIAFEASARPMQCKDIYDWVERNYEFYRLSPPSWKARIRAELSANPSFERTVNEEGANAWRLVEGVDTQSWGVTRGPRRKRGTAASSQEPNSQTSTPLPANETMAADEDDDNIVVVDSSRSATPQPLENQYEGVQRVKTQTQAHAGVLHARSEPTSGGNESMDVHDDEALRDVDHLLLDTAFPKPQRKSPKVASRKPRPKKSIRRKKSKQPTHRANSLQEQQTIDLTMMDDELSSDPAPAFDSPAPAKGNSNSTPHLASSPLFVRPSTPASAYRSRNTPRSSSVRSSSVKQEPTSHSKNSPLPMFVQRSTPFGSSLRRTSGLARFMETSMHELEHDEDELA